MLNNLYPMRERTRLLPAGQWKTGIAGTLRVQFQHPSMTILGNGLDFLALVRLDHITNIDIEMGVAVEKVIKVTGNL